MEGITEQPTFNLEKTIDQTPFADPIVRSTFVEWCRINDGIKPKFEDRADWQKRLESHTLLEDGEEGTKNLYVPRDLHLWEMVDVMEAVDTDTFTHNPERKKLKAEELRKLSKTFMHAGIYFSQRMDSIDQGRQIAEDLALQFFDYGSVLASGQKNDGEVSIDDLATFDLTEDETENVDKWLAGDEFYQVNMSQVDKIATDNHEDREEIVEQQRRKKLAQYFRVSEKSFDLQKRDDGETLAPWESSVSDAFPKKAQSRMQREIEKPKTELSSSIFRRGMELLQRNMPLDSLPEWVRKNVHKWENAEITLRPCLKSIE